MKVEKILFQGKSDYQNVLVFQVLLYEDESSDVLSFTVNFALDGLMLEFWFMCPAVINIWKGSCFGWGDSAYRER